MKITAKYIPCDCGGRATKGKVSRTFKIGRRSVTVDNIPGFVCPKCGEIFYDGPSVIRIGKKLEREAVV